MAGTRAYHHSDPHISGAGLGVAELWERLDALRPTLREMWLFSVSGGETSGLQQSSLDPRALLRPLSPSFPHPSLPKEKEGQTGFLIWLAGAWMSFGNPSGDSEWGETDLSRSPTKNAWGRGAGEDFFFPFFLSLNSRTADWFRSCKWKALDFSIRHSHLRASCHPLCAASLNDVAHVLGTKRYQRAIYNAASYFLFPGLFVVFSELAKVHEKTQKEKFNTAELK